MIKSDILKLRSNTSCCLQQFIIFRTCRHYNLFILPFNLINKTLNLKLSLNFKQCILNGKCTAYTLIFKVCNYNVHQIYLICYIMMLLNFSV